MTGEDDPVAARSRRPEPSAAATTSPASVGCVVAVGRGVREAVAAQVDRHDVPDAAQPARDGRPRPGRVRQAVDEQDPGPAPTPPPPVEEMDPVAGLDDDNEAVGLGGGIRRRHGLHRP